MAWLYLNKTILRFKFLLFTNIIFSGYVAEANQITATAYPVATTKLIGNSVQFECNVSEPPGSSQTLQWYIEWDDDTEPIRLLLATSTGDISVANRPEFSGRGDYETQYEVENTASGYTNHKCTLNIGATTLKDNGYFGCTHQTPGESHRTLLDQKARLTIVPQPTANPECNLNKHNKVFVLTCVSLQGDPKAHLTWYEGNELQSEAIQTFNSIEITEVDNQETRTFECHAKQGEKDVGTCAVTLTGDTGETDNTITLAPTTTVTTVMPTTSNSSVTAALVAGSNTGAVVGAVLGVLFLLLLLLLLLLLFYRRRRRQRKESKTTVEAPQTELPTIDLARDNVIENHYGDVEPRPSTSSELPLADHDELDKPWKKNPELLEAYLSGEFVDGDEISINSATESDERGAAAYPRDQIYDDVYDNYTY